MIKENKENRDFEVVNTDKGQVQLINMQDITEGQLWCDKCKYNDNCEEILEHCVNFIFNGKVCHPKSVEVC